MEDLTMTRAEWREEFIAEKRLVYEKMGITDKNEQWLRMQPSLSNCDYHFGWKQPISVDMSQYGESELTKYTSDGYGFGYAGFAWLKDKTGIELIKSNIPDDLLLKLENTAIIKQWYNQSLANKPHEHYYQIDRNSAYESCLAFDKMPRNPIYVKDGFVPETANTYVFYTSKTKLLLAEDNNFRTEVVKSYVFDIFPKEYFNEWFAEFGEQRAINKALTKKLAVAAIGYARRSKQAWAFAVYKAQRHSLFTAADAVRKQGGKVIKVHTDSVGYLDPNGTVVLDTHATEFGKYKYEYQDVIIQYKNAGAYNIWDKDGKELANKAQGGKLKNELNK